MGTAAHPACVVSEGTPACRHALTCHMARYRCCFLNENGQVARLEDLNSSDDGDAHRDAMSLLARTGRFSGYELWRGGRKVDDFKPPKAANR
jgi:hypothetical protein